MSFTWTTHDGGAASATRDTAPNSRPNSAPNAAPTLPQTRPRAALTRAIRAAARHTLTAIRHTWVTCRRYGIELVAPAVTLTVWATAWQIRRNGHIWFFWPAKAAPTTDTGDTPLFGGGIVWRQIDVSPWVWVLAAATTIVGVVVAATVAKRETTSQRASMAAFIAGVATLAGVTAAAPLPWPVTWGLAGGCAAGAVWWVLQSPIDMTARGYRRAVRAHRVRRLWGARCATVCTVAGEPVAFTVQAATEDALAARVTLRVKPGQVTPSQTAGLLAERGPAVWGTVRWADGTRSALGPDTVTAHVHPDDAARVDMRVQRVDPLADLVRVNTVDHAAGTVRIGRDTTGRAVEIKPADGHVLACGMTRSGKTATERLIAAGAVAAGHQLVVVDVAKPADWTCFTGALAHPVADTPTAAVMLLEWARKQIDVQRVGMPADATDMASLPAGQQVWLTVVVDELASLTDMNDKRAVELVNEIARLGLASGVRLVVGCQKPTADMLPSSLLAQLAVRWVGVLGDPAARVVLGDSPNVPVMPSALPPAQLRGLFARPGVAPRVMRSDYLDPADVRVLCAHVGRQDVPVTVGRQVPGSEHQAATLAVLVDAGTPLTAAEVAERSGRDVRQCRRDLNALVRDGHASPVGGRPERWTVTGSSRPG